MRNSTIASIVLLNFNGRRFVKDCMATVFQQDYRSYEIILVDNGSRDGSVELLQEIACHYPNVPFKVIRNKVNLGYSVGNNQGVEMASGKYIVLLSNDIRVEPDWLSSMVGVLEDRDDIAVAQSQMYSLYAPSVPDPQANYLDVLGLCHRYLPTQKIAEVFYSEGACMFIRRATLAETGGLFDSDYIMFNEDVDFCWRAKLLGHKVCVVPQSKAFHARGGTVAGVLIKTQPLFTFSTSRNRLTTLYKNYELRNVFRFLPLTLAFEGLKCMWLIFNGRHRAGVSGLKGVVAFLVDLRKTQRKRILVQRMRKVSDETIVSQMLSLKDAIRSSTTYAVEITREWRRGSPSI